VVKGKKVLLTGEKDPSKLNWKNHKIDVVMDCTGLFLTTEKA